MCILIHKVTTTKMNEGLVARLEPTRSVWANPQGQSGQDDQVTAQNVFRRFTVRAPFRMCVQLDVFLQVVQCDRKRLRQHMFEIKPSPSNCYLYLDGGNKNEQPVVSNHKVLRQPTDLNLNTLLSVHHSYIVLLTILDYVFLFYLASLQMFISTSSDGHLCLSLP